MDLDYQWLLLALPAVFFMGWAASRLDLRQLRRDESASPQAYFKGLNLLLNEQQDRAIDAFIEAVQHDPQASDLHFALGNLFRRRGEYERAIRVHEHLLARADISRDARERAQHALAHVAHHAIDIQIASRNSIGMIETFIGKFNDVTVFTKQDIVFCNTHQNAQFGVSDEVSVLAVNWNEEFGFND